MTSWTAMDKLNICCRILTFYLHIFYVKVPWNYPSENWRMETADQDLRWPEFVFSSLYN